MKTYYGTKRIAAEPEARDGKPGYAVLYPDGYRSWSPANTFEAAYQPLEALSFGHALAALREGRHVARDGWNGKGMFLFLFDDAPGLAPFIAINTGKEVRQWMASQADMLADDWTVVG